ncbi:MAG: tRNA preQ1(34) S-adenosylmethionine ribosyltransferase-isomerase QueA [Elusimicrobia bacterium RIFCSPLOWO2_02_FULL_39_32]|nr:MAG: tRNA preQ1(34) S-adenosylmethionine ribosyltransferase-isomerase QueA [Elusimicrobia bacterium GWA2_38_7]OGR78987.1 MAG: tRNA preQ1(34) S-adenosylmethionine ribosyltransferase-isomerase QueA [Elusimicrobia bacterium RIFCSPHIGHO2_02_FULL_39_36]OGR92571.1 MAG: tRNA preQ1(34) S-adenosylmethionine ribosyltransferase-isomerase QueA [Elusimicrobia bacterium RIFCSPLOWO2_02_FULL_39_32]OGR99219.1 MAG: tRNA preQ1(34) S-adenosylmethionine ribosyltransferase-isomerase QueA [Elusimicrobia bacterium R
MNLSEFDYFLPKELIAQEGLKERENAKLMVVYPDNKREDHFINELPSFFKKGDLVVLNDTRVLSTKLIGQKETGGKIDCLLLPDFYSKETDLSPGEKEALIRGPKIKVGTKLKFFPNQIPEETRVLHATVIEKIKGTCFRIAFDDPSLIPLCAILPLPPYIKKKLEDPERYQTIYAKKEGALAAPTAGLHFTAKLMEELEKLGVEFVFLTLHIGIGTFAPIRAEKLEEWKMHPEYYKVNEFAAQKINQAIGLKKRIFAVGTTTVRTLESCFNGEFVEAKEGWTNLFIIPGAVFKFPYAGLLTNFHLPKSSLILLASAFMGKEKLLEAYQEAIAKKYRFYSFGDAMLILH